MNKIVLFVALMVFLSIFFISLSIVQLSKPVSIENDLRTIDYLEYQQTFAFKNHDYSFHQYLSSKDMLSIDDTSHMKLNFNERELFDIEFWQINNGSKVRTANPCYNTGSICFKNNNDDMLLIIHELTNEFIINDNDLLKSNKRIFNVTRIDDSIYTYVHVEHIMPKYAKDLQIMPLFMMYIPVDTDLVEPCEFDRNPRLCLVEKKLQELENKKQ